MDGSPDTGGIFHLLASGARRGPTFSGYRPVHKLHENYFTSGEHKYLDSDQVPLGGSARVAVGFITPEVYPRSLWKGREVTVHEDEYLTSTLKVTRVLNPNLRGSAANYNPLWTEPLGLKQP